LPSVRVRFHLIKSIESIKGIPRNVLTIGAAGVLPVYFVSFELAQETNKVIDKSVAMSFIKLNFCKLQPGK
jgi:hypothetical protein